MLSWLKFFFGHPAVTAFLGAFFALLLVMVIDRIRRLKKRTLLRRLVIINRRLVERKVEAIEMIQKVYKEKHRVIPATLMPFAIKEIVSLQTDVVDLLSDNEKVAIDTICYFMEAIDKEVQGNVELINRLIEIQPKLENEQELEPEAINLYQRVGYGYVDILVNLGRLAEMIDMFEAGDYEGILNKKYRTGDGEGG